MGLKRNFSATISGSLFDGRTSTAKIDLWDTTADAPRSVTLPVDEIIKLAEYLTKRRGLASLGWTPGDLVTEIEIDTDFSVDDFDESIREETAEKIEDGTWTAFTTTLYRVEDSGDLEILGSLSGSVADSIRIPGMFKVSELNEFVPEIHYLCDVVRDLVDSARSEFGISPTQEERASLGL